MLEIIGKGIKTKIDHYAIVDPWCVPSVLYAVLVPSILGRIKQKKSVKTAIRRMEKGFLHEQGLN